MDEQKLEQALRASDLIVKYLKGDLTDKEQTELDSWIEQSDANRALFSEMTNPVSLNQQMDEMARIDVKAAHQKLSNRLFPGGNGVLVQSRSIWRYAAAAAVIVMVGIAAIWYFNRSTEKAAPQVVAQAAPAIVPGSKKARLVMEDGHVVELETQSDSSFKSGEVLVTNTKDGLLSYKKGEGGKGPIDHTIIVPRGSEYVLWLEDGTRVWLNAASTLRYPTKFAGNDRRVILTGEAYFSVAENKAKPFHVMVNDMDVMVTGTEFNINAYSDEALIKSTLLKGGVRITRNNNSYTLTPGQELQVADNGQAKVISNADVDAATAWMNGLFNLEEADIPTLMRSISRWYDIQVTYPEGVPQGKFSGQISRSLEFSKLLEVLNAGGIKTKVEGKKLTIY